MASYIFLAIGATYVAELQQLGSVALTAIFRSPTSGHGLEKSLPLSPPAKGTTILDVNS